jgi:hypothetical protein
MTKKQLNNYKKTIDWLMTKKDFDNAEQEFFVKTLRLYMFCRWARESLLKLKYEYEKN